MFYVFHTSLESVCQSGLMAKKKSSSSKPSKRGKHDGVDFEAVLGEVERIVNRLESGELDLTESLEQYERGVGQLKDCHSILGDAERRVTLLSGFDEDGNPVTETMSDVATGTSSAADQGDSSAPQGGHRSGPTMDDSTGLF